MGDLIVLSERLEDRARHTRSMRPSFFFDLACPFSYLAMERIERVLGDVEWIPAASVALRRIEASAPGAVIDSAAVRAVAEERAGLLRLPLLWPDRFPAHHPRALRTAAYASEIGAAPRFALAASRLAFCGGFDLDDPEILAEASAAAGMQLEACLAAAADSERDVELHATALGLLSRGVHRLPAIRIGRHWFEGEQRLVEAAGLLRARAIRRPSLAPAG
jgi:2-hydroxychromene-2-carboxylate isomerase